MTSQSGWNRETSPYHDGEQELHDRLGLRERQEMIGRRIHRPYLIEQHREFYEQLPFLVVGSTDGDGQPWASMLFGLPGFVTTPNDRSVRVEGGIVPGDALRDNLRPGAPLGMLGIELPTRRRNRVNGVVSQADDGAFTMDVVQSYGNCPQYIQTRTLQYEQDPGEPVHVEIERFTTLSDELRAALRAADTFYVASSNPKDDPRDTGGVDVNHRGGMPGFVGVEGDLLTIPDFAGNNAFNTLGNFLRDPRAGLLFVDFESGDLIQLAGRVEIVWEPTAEIRAFEGARRAWTFRLERGVRLAAASPLRGTLGEYSPRSEATGTWEHARARRTSEEAAGADPA